VVIKKKAGQPIAETINPDVGAMKILPSAAREDRSAYWVALYL
jgi:hypothetical protein